MTLNDWLTDWVNNINNYKVDEHQGLGLRLVVVVADDGGESVMLMPCDVSRGNRPISLTQELVVEGLNELWHHKGRPRAQYWSTFSSSSCCSCFSIDSPSMCGWVYKFHAWPGARLISSHRLLPSGSSHLISSLPSIIIGLLSITHYWLAVVTYSVILLVQRISSWLIIYKFQLSNSFASRSYFYSTVSLSPSSSVDVQLILFWLIAHVILWDDCPFHGQAALIMNAFCLIDGLPLFFGSPRSTCIGYLASEQ